MKNIAVMGSTGSIGTQTLAVVREHPELFQELLCAAISDARRRGGRFMTFFCEKEYQQTALACGFVCVDNYLCFKIRLD